MKDFSHITEVGRGRSLYSTTASGIHEELFRTTTNEYILSRGTEDIILTDLDAALSWAKTCGLCLGKRDFLQRCVNVMRIPYADIQLMVCIFDECEADEHRTDSSTRILELIQHPAYNTCIVKHSGGEETLCLDSKQRDQVIRMVSTILESDYYSEGSVDLAGGMEITYRNSDQFREALYLQINGLGFELETFFVFAGFDLPVDFSRRKIDETTWLRVKDAEAIWSSETSANMAMVAIAVNIHFQLNFERVYSSGEDPLEILDELPW
ncbi:MAG: hypothetical protein ACSHX8_08590 [Opitutaceae bacterium]